MKHNDLELSNLPQFLTKSKHWLAPEVEPVVFTAPCPLRRVGLVP